MFSLLPSWALFGFFPSLIFFTLFLAVAFDGPLYPSERESSLSFSDSGVSSLWWSLML